MLRTDVLYPVLDPKPSIIGLQYFKKIIKKAERLLLGVGKRKF